MHPRFRRLVFVLLTLTASRFAAEPAENGRPRTIADEAIRAFRFHPPEKSPELSVVLLRSSEDAPVMLPAYQVKELPNRTFQDLTASIAHAKSLESPALVKMGQLELFFPFDSILGKDAAGQPRAMLPILRLRF